MNLQKIIEDTKRSYEKAGKQYFELFHNELDKHDFDQQVLKDFMSSLSSDPIICDFGCGPAAQYSSFALPYSKKVYALDNSPQNIEIAIKENPNIHFKCENMLETTFSDSYLDGIISFYAIFHIPKEHDNKFFEEAFRILKPGGRLFIMTHKGDLVQTFNELWNHDDLNLFANFHSEKELISSAKKSGFTVESCYSEKSYYGFPEERILLTTQKPLNST